MIETKLLKFKDNIKYTELKDIYTKDDISDYLEPTGVSADIQEIEKIFNDYIKESTKEEWYLDTTKRSQKDAEHSKIVHKALKKIPRSLALDMRFWQWLSLCKFRKYTIFRWSLNTQDFPKEKDLRKIIKKNNYEKDMSLIESNNDDKKPAFVGHLIGGSQMKALTSIHSISRLFWISNYLWNSTDHYKLVEIAYSYQDIAQSLVERKYAMNKTVAQSFVKNIQDKYLSKESNQDKLKYKIQSAAKNLNISFATINANYLDVKDITELMD